MESLRVAMLDFASFESTAALANVLAAHCVLHLIVPERTYAYIRDDLDPRCSPDRAAPRRRPLA